MAFNNSQELSLANSARLFGILACDKLNSIFYHSSTSNYIYIIVYVDGIIITRNDHKGINQLKQHLSHHFQPKDLEKL